jgi:hypothetical protein
LKSRDKSLAFCGWADSDEHMIRGGFQGEDDRHKLIALARDGSAPCRVTRRVNALVLLDDEWTCREREGTEEASRIAQISTDVSNRAARAGTEILEQSSVEIAARLTERSADQFGRVWGIFGEEVHKAAQKSPDNFDAIIQSSSVLAKVTQSISREWANFMRKRMQQNLNRFERLLRCRTPQDMTAVQSEILRDNLESFLHCARRVAETSMQVADEATKRQSKR